MARNSRIAGAKRHLLAVLVAISLAACGDEEAHPPTIGDLPLPANASVRDSQYALGVTGGRILYVVVVSDDSDGSALQQRERALLARDGWRFTTPGHELPMNRETAEAHSPDGIFLTMSGKQCEEFGAPEPLAARASAAIRNRETVLCVTLARP
jgi:hypothetical protein